MRWKFWARKEHRPVIMAIQHLERTDNSMPMTFVLYKCTCNDERHAPEVKAFPGTWTQQELEAPAAFQAAKVVDAFLGDMKGKA